MYMAAGKWRAEKDKVQPLAAEQLGVGGGTDIRERQGQKHNQTVHGHPASTADSPKSYVSAAQMWC